MLFVLPILIYIAVDTRQNACRAQKDVHQQRKTDEKKEEEEIIIIEKVNAERVNEEVEEIN